MKTLFDLDKAIDKSIEIIMSIEDFYRNFTEKHFATIKVYDMYFIQVADGIVLLQYNNEGYNDEPYDPVGNRLGDHTFETIVCDVKNCNKTENEIRSMVNIFLTNIPGFIY